MVTGRRRLHSVAMRSAAAVAHGTTSTAEDQQRAEQRVVALRVEPGLDRGDRAAAEDQRRDAQRNDQQDQQHAAAAQAERQRRAEPAEQAQHRRAEQQADHQRGDRIGAHVEQQAEQRRREHQRQAGQQPVRQRLGGGDQQARLAAAAASARASRRRGRRHRAASPTASRRAARTPTPRRARSARSVCVSGPTPSGNRLTATAKKASGSRASTRRRAASRRSRTTSAPNSDAGGARGAGCDRARRQRRGARLRLMRRRRRRGAACSGRAGAMGVELQHDRLRDRAASAAGGWSARRSRRAAPAPSAGRRARRCRPGRARRRVRRAPTARARHRRARSSARRASATRRRWPCDRVRTGALRRFADAERLQRRSQCRRVGRPAVDAGQKAAAPRARSGRPSAHWHGRCGPADRGTRPRPRRRAGWRRASGSCRPPASDRPVSSRSRLVLPRPLAPRIHSTWPASSARSSCLEQQSLAAPAGQPGGTQRRRRRQRREVGRHRDGGQGGRCGRTETPLSRERRFGADPGCGQPASIPGAGATPGDAGYRVRLQRGGTTAGAAGLPGGRPGPEGLA